ncbi:MAG: DUF5817 domain-containing protein [Halobacteriales archaeon]|nr:DUF5817 domain-containing protein [Halobacteriales archaeon]
MYRVVGCRDCGALWIVADRPETTTCPRCGKRHPTERLHAFAEVEDEDAARRARAALLADRAGQADAFAEVDADLAGQLDFEAVARGDVPRGVGPRPRGRRGRRRAGDRRPRPGRSRRETVLGALEDLERPTEAAVVEYAAEHDVAPEAVPPLLEKLVRAGEVSESGGRYRRL